MSSADKEITRLIGRPVPFRRNWRRIILRFGFVVLILLMLGFGFYYISQTEDEEASLNLTAFPSNVLTSDVPGAEGLYESDDIPGEVVLSDREFVMLVDKATKH